MKVKFLHSIRFDVFSKMTLLILIFMVFGMVFSIFFLDEYYESMKMDSLIESAAALKNIYQEDLDAFYSEAESVSEKLGALYLIYDYQAAESVANPFFTFGRGAGRFSTSVGQGQRSDQMATSLVDLDAHDLEVVKSQGYELVKDYNDRLNSAFYSIAFLLDDTNLMVLNVPLSVIDDAVMVARNFFLVLSGLLFVVGAIFSFFISRSIAGPIVRLNDAAGEMAMMRFDTFYHEERRDEIGMLGRTFNLLSTRLSHAIGQLNSANEQLKEDLSVIERSEKLREEFVASASHELKTPVAVIQGYAEGLRDLDDPLKRERYVDVIVKESERMDRLIRDLLNLSELESHYTQLVPVEFDLQEVVREELDSFRTRIAEKQAVVRFMPVGPTRVRGDRDKLTQVVRNYLSNALQHVPESGWIRIDLVHLDAAVQLRVENEGNPIPNDRIGEIWGAFYKVDKARSREYGGTGLGLSIVRRICELHGIGYGVENTRDGVVFWADIARAGNGYGGV